VFRTPVGSQRTSCHFVGIQRHEPLIFMDFPELVIGLAGAIGVDLERLAGSLNESLSRVGYQTAFIKLTDEMQRLKIAETKKKLNADIFSQYQWKIEYANALRREYKHADLLARIAVVAIRQLRSTFTNEENVPAEKMAYIVRQLKRPEEVTLLRRLYGKQFILISAYAPHAERKNLLIRKIKEGVSTTASEAEIEHMASQLIERDASEETEEFGQQLRETFHHADVFVDGIDQARMLSTLDRFVSALFGLNQISPSKDEYGMYAAKSASLRSADLSRQVGAAIFSPDGEVITQGQRPQRAHRAERRPCSHPPSPSCRDDRRGHATRAGCLSVLCATRAPRVRQSPLLRGPRSASSRRVAERS